MNTNSCVVRIVVWIDVFQFNGVCRNVDRYWSVLTGDKQVPPNSTDSVGFIGLKFQEDMKRLVFNVNVENIENITGVYI